jgi:hypothetical protein
MASFASLRTRKTGSTSKSPLSRQCLRCEGHHLLTHSHSLEKDPAHLEFVASLDGIVQNVRVVDFEPGVF